MTYRQVVNARLQYPTVQEALGAAQWLTTWKAIHYASVRPAGTTQQTDAVIPPTPAPDPPIGDGVSDQLANGQLTFTLHVEAADFDSCQALTQEVVVALSHIVSEGATFNCMGNSELSVDPE